MLQPLPLDPESDALPSEVRLEAAPRVTLAVRRWDPQQLDGPPFLLVHGLASNARTWDAVAQFLAAAGHPVAALDQRGHGRSDKPDVGYDMERITDDLAAVVQQLGFERPIVVGQSWGGNVVLELAYRFPGLVRGIACVDGGHLELAGAFASWEECAERLAPPRLAGLSVTAIEARIRAAHPDWPETGIAGALANFEVRSDGTIAPWLTFERHMSILRGLWEHRPSTQWSAVEVPVLLIPAETGDADWTATKRLEIERAEEMLPRGRVRWFAPADHDIQAQHPRELAEVLDASTRDGFFT